MSQIPEQCRIGDHHYGSLLDERGNPMCDLCGHREILEDDATDFYESNDLEDSLDYLLRIDGGVIDERCDNY